MLVPGAVVWALLATLWALIVTIILFRNPFPFPDRGHRAYGLSSEEARKAVLKVLREVGGVKEHFTVRAGPTHQTLMWDGYTVLNYVDTTNLGTNQLPSNAISIPVGDPQLSAEKALAILETCGYPSVITQIADNAIP